LKKFSTYRDAGVDIDLGNEFVNRIKPLVRSTFKPGVHSEIGGFGAAFSLNMPGDRQYVLVSSTDGVGTKLKVAFMMDKHDTVGIDLVAMCVNDIVVMGAEPLFFLDYFATGKLAVDVTVKVIEGIANGCKESGCSLVGGETAEMPDMYAPGEYDLAGFTVGLVENANIIDGSTITVGNKIIGIASSGLHSNGFSLVRKIVFQQLGLSVNDHVPEFGDQTVGEMLLTPTKLYVKPILNLMRDCKINGMAHITGGGLIDNIPRVLPKGSKALIHLDSWRRPAVFDFLQHAGEIEEKEMLRTFNCGIGLTLICPEFEEETILSRLKGMGQPAWTIGEVTEREPGEEPIEFI